MSDDAASAPDDAAAPLAATDRIAALDVLRGFALLGVFIMNMPGFSHSLFAAPQGQRAFVDAVVEALRSVLFAGKFNLLFGVCFGVSFALQMRRLEAAARTRPGTSHDPGRPARIYVRRLSFLLVVGLIHATLVWSGDVLLVYALLGFALLAARRVADGALRTLLVACLLFPAVAEVLRPVLFAGGEAVAAFQYQQWERSNDLAFGRGSFADAVRETARIFAWSWRSPLGLFSYSSFFVQMATGIVAGFLLGRRDWPALPLGGESTERGLVRTSFVVALASALVGTLGVAVLGGTAGAFVGVLGTTISRASLAAFYALVVVRFVRRLERMPAWLLAVQQAGRMPLTNYLLQTALASFIFYGWGLGLWNTAGPMVETALAILLFVAVQLPLSVAWMARWRYGPLEYVWRRFTYDAPLR